MSKERLEEIKTRFNAMKELESFKKLAPTDLFFDDLNWLLQQAECVEELEKVEYALQETYRQEREYNKKLEQQNQRYKQALDFLKLKLVDFERHAEMIRRLADNELIKNEAKRLREDVSDTFKVLEQENNG